jgi:hypothetical protein
MRIFSGRVNQRGGLGFSSPPSLRSDLLSGGVEEATMASRNLARGGSQEHHNAEARLEDARENRDVMERRWDAARDSGVGDLEASVAVGAAEEQLAAREAWLKWVERDY